MLPMVMSIILAAGLYIGHCLAPTIEQPQGEAQKNYQKLQDIIHLLDQRYVDSIDREDLFERTIADMLHSLDPHSNYIPARDLQALNEQIDGQFSGVGVRFFVIRDTICITNVLPGSPSERAGIKSGDKIIKIDGKTVAGKLISNDEVMSSLKGKTNTEVKVVVLRGKKRLQKTITRGAIPIESVISHYMISGDVGFIKINSFSRTTADEFRQVAKSLKQKGMKKIILDLRNNGGGVLTAATQIADEFLSANKTIVVTKGENFPRQEYRSTSVGELEKMPVAILINANSASASEILAGAIQDNDRGTIVGRRSFGKGLVQEDMQLRDGSNLRLTIARYYTPTGRCIQKPYSGDMSEYYEDHASRYDNGELYHVDSSVFVDSLKFTTPGGKLVYGGGGIMPDIFVPYDSSGITPYFTALRFTSAFTTFAFDYVSNKRNKWKTPAAFTRQFKVGTDLLRQFAEYANDEYQIPMRGNQLNYSSKLISKVLKAEIARQIWVEQGYYQSINTTDKEVKAALKVLR